MALLLFAYLRPQGGKARMLAFSLPPTELRPCSGPDALQRFARGQRWRGEAQGAEGDAV